MDTQLWATGQAVIAAREYLGTVRNGKIEFTESVDWPDGTQVFVRDAEASDFEFQPKDDFGKVIIAGFGLAGRWVADIFERHHIPYVIVEKNIHTVETQHHLGKEIVEGDVGDEQTLRRAGIEDASILALTIPDEEAVLRATQTARRLKPDIYIVARTNYTSQGMRASQLGADDVVKAEQAVARQFYEMLMDKLKADRSKTD